MQERVINEWLCDTADLVKEDMKAYSADLNDNVDLIASLYSYLEDVTKYTKIVNIVEVCNTLFKFYRSGEEDLKLFTMRFLPQILYNYLNSIAHGDKKHSHVIEALIIGIYNLEIIDETNGQPKVISFRLPSLAQNSVFHECGSLAPASLTEAALKRLEQQDAQLVRWGPLSPIDKLNAQTRLPILTELVFCYNRRISQLSKASLEQMCRVTSKIVTQGFSKWGNNASMYRRSSLTINDSSAPPMLPRITVSSSFLCQMLYSLYFAMFNGFKYESLQAVEDIFVRASYQCLTEVLLLTNAIKNSAYSIHAVQPDGTSVGISASLRNAWGSTSVSTTPVAKSMITNASFRTKKLPDDIPIQDNAEDGNLTAIQEEREEQGGGTEGIPTTTGLHQKKSLPKMAANFGKKTKEKIVIAVKSGSVAGMRVGQRSNSTNTPIAGGSGGGMESSVADGAGEDIFVELGSVSETAGEDVSVSFTCKKNNSVDLDLSRSMQISSV